MLAWVGKHGICQYQNGSSRPRATIVWEFRAAVRAAVTLLDSSLSTIHRRYQPFVVIHHVHNIHFIVHMWPAHMCTIWPFPWLRERNSHQSLWHLPLTTVHRRVRLKWCRARSTRTCVDWGRISLVRSPVTNCVLTTTASWDVLGSMWGGGTWLS